MLRGVAVTTVPLVFDPAERRGCMVCPVLAAVTDIAPPAELAPRRRKARRMTLPAPVVVTGAPGQPPDPDRCTCDPTRWKLSSGSRLRHEPTCPRSLASR